MLYVTGSADLSESVKLTEFRMKTLASSPVYLPGASVQFISVQLFGHVWLFATPWTLGLPVNHQLPGFTQTHVHQVSDAMQPSHPLLLLPSIFPSIRFFPNESTLPIKWPKFWSFSFSISPFNEYSRLSSFRIDSLGLLAVQGTLKRLLQYHSSKSSSLWCSAFFRI